MAKKILIVGAILLVFSFILVPWKPNEILTFLWQQQPPAPNDLAGWRLYQSTTPGGPYTLVQTIPFTIAQTEYRASVPIKVSGGQLTTLYFVLTAYDTSGNESIHSNEASLTLDFQTRFWSYDFIWAGKRNMTVNYMRVILQAIVIAVGTALVCFLSLKKKRSLVERPSKEEKVEGKKFYCETCEKELTNQNAAEVHQAFKHEVREI